MQEPQSANFTFFALYEPQLERIGALAERYFRDDPSTCLIKLRQFSELLAQSTAARTNHFIGTEERQIDLIRRLRDERILPQYVTELFHQVRHTGNRATHGNVGDHAEALSTLKIARVLGIWFHQTFVDTEFSPGPFVPPPDPAAATQTLYAELERLRQDAQAARSDAEKAQIVVDQAARERLSAEEQAQQAREEQVLWESLATEADQARAALAEQLAALQAATAVSPQATARIIAKAERAAAKIELDEAATRTIIDEQLRAVGWQADSQHLRYSTGARPVKGQNRAIAEWPTASGPADYALFVGLQCIGVVEAKRQQRNVSSAIDQAQRYARGVQFAGGAVAVGGPWPEAGLGAFLVPFVFSTNGRAYLRQLETSSGVWFRDVRKPHNLRRALVGWPTPGGLRDMLAIDAAAAHAELQSQPIAFAFPLRPYQQRAIETVELHLAKDRRTMLLAMATGTGKTKLAIAMLYRLLNAKRFRRVCFVVDRNVLGQQAEGEFATTRIVSARTFADIFGLKGLDAATPDSETKVHICTIQSLVKRVLYAEEAADVPPVDQYDLMVVDECHRGYLLDREMSDAELSFRSQDEYVSTYRRVLEHFDAVKIGLTATPALHTVSIFGDPVFTYSYREAVIDGFLIDHEPPTQITTALARAGITFGPNEQIEMLDANTGAVNLAHLPDELSFEVTDFNRRVVTLAFNRAVAEELAQHIDPSMPGKTLIFAVTNDHADIVVDEIKKAFSAAYGEIEDAAVCKVTGKVENVGSLIRSYRNDDLPKIAVTVDLLTTGIDVPKIENLVFLRRVNSRILYEQMLGRATRRCDEIGKETFRIFDAVDLYQHVQQVSEMRPVVVNPAISFEQLFTELMIVTEPEHLEAVREQLVVKLRRRLNRLPEQARTGFEAAAGETPEAMLQRLLEQPTADTATWVQARGNLGRILDWESAGGGPVYMPISHHPDRVLEVRSGYGAGQRPEDFLQSFGAFVQGNSNVIAALYVVTQRPRDLTRAELRQLRLDLDSRGFGEIALQRAWADARNEDIAASIIGFVRQAALGDPLVPYADRVRAALRRILAQRQWTPVQQKWLKRIEEQMIREVLVDRAAFDEEPFTINGGFRFVNNVFGGQLEQLLADLHEQVWEQVA